jgi:hypothetical protein
MDRVYRCTYICGAIKEAILIPDDDIRRNDNIVLVKSNNICFSIIDYKYTKSEEILINLDNSEISNPYNYLRSKLIQFLLDFKINRIIE